MCVVSSVDQSSQKSHKCRSQDKMKDVVCTVVQCKKPAALCKAHCNNASPELKSWLSKCNINPKEMFAKPAAVCLPAVKSKPVKRKNITSYSNDDEVKIKKIVDIHKNVSVKMPSGKTSSRKTSSQIPKDDKSPRKKSLETDTGTTDAEDLNDGQVNIDYMDAVMVVDDDTDGSDHEKAAVNATGNHNTQVKSVVHPELLSAVDSYSNFDKAGAENISTVPNSKKSNNSKCSKSSSVNTDRKLSNVMTSPKVTTGNLIVSHTQPVKQSEKLMTGNEDVVGRKRFDVQNVMPTGEEI